MRRGLPRWRCCDDLNILQMPKTCPWCHHALKLEGMSLYMQIYTYLDHAKSGRSCTNTYTGILEGSEVKRQAFPNVRELLSVKDKKAIKNFRVTSNHRLHLWKGTSSVAISGRNNDGVHCQVRREGKRGDHSPIGCVEDETEGSPKGG